MPKFLVCFRVEQTLSGSIEVEAETAAEAKSLFDARGYCPDATPETEKRIRDVDCDRNLTKLDLEDSEDSITEIQNMETGESYAIEED